MQTADYTVKINGLTVETDTARVSAMPFNRRWPGHQRPLDQTELVDFVSFTYTEKLEFEITPQRPFKSVDIRPASLGIAPEIKDGKIYFTLDKPAYFTVEAFGRNHALHIFADEPKEYELSGNVIRYGKGVHEVGVIELKSNTTLYLEDGAVVYGSIVANDAENIRIVGHGILDNSHTKERILFPVEDSENTKAILNAKRTDATVFKFCNNIEIDGIMIRDSLVYNIRPIACRNIKISNVKLLGNWRYNSDGIDMHNCENVDISHCFIRTYDDCICVKGWDFLMDANDMYHNGDYFGKFDNIRVSDCVLWNDWGRALEIGAETYADEICNVTFENCDVIHATHNILDCQNVDCADIHDITYRNINIEYDDSYRTPVLQTSDTHKYPENDDGSYYPVFFESVVYYHPEYSSSGLRRGKNREITVENINVSGAFPLKVSLKGFDSEHKSSDIVFRNITQNGKRAILDITQNEYCENIKEEN